jgi:hypothetical protein
MGAFITVHKKKRLGKENRDYRVRREERDKANKNLLCASTWCPTPSTSKPKPKTKFGHVSPQDYGYVIARRVDAKRREVASVRMKKIVFNSYNMLVHLQNKKEETNRHRLRPNPQALRM